MHSWLGAIVVTVYIKLRPVFTGSVMWEGDSAGPIRYSFLCSTYSTRVRINRVLLGTMRPVLVDLYSSGVEVQSLKLISKLAH